MMPMLSDLADYMVAAWVMETGSWRFLFDSSDGQHVVQHELKGVSHWRTSELRNSIGVMEIRLLQIDGSVPTDVSFRMLLVRALGFTSQTEDAQLLRSLELLKGTVAYTIETVCNETIDVVCAEVRETVIKHRGSQA